MLLFVALFYFQAVCCGALQSLYDKPLRTYLPKGACTECVRAMIGQESTLICEYEQKLNN